MSRLTARTTYITAKTVFSIPPMGRPPTGRPPRPPPPPQAAAAAATATPAAAVVLPAEETAVTEMKLPDVLHLREHLFGGDIEFRVERELGKGVYGRVLQVRRAGTQVSFALKEVLNEESPIADDTQAQDHQKQQRKAASKKQQHTPASVSDMPLCSDIQQCALREVVLMKCLAHPNILQLHGVPMFDCHGTMYVGFQLMCGGDMSKRLHKQYDKYQTGFDVDLVRRWMHELLSAMHALHARNIFHRDLKPHNLLLDASDRLCVADFGLARGTLGSQAMTYTPTVITLWYRPLELLLGGSTYGATVDMWSCGAILYELFTGRALFETNPEKEDKDELMQAACIMKTMGIPNEKMWPGVTKFPYYQEALEAIEYVDETNHLADELQTHQVSLSAQDLLLKLLAHDPSKRMSAGDALRHPFFAEQPRVISSSLSPSAPDSTPSTASTSATAAAATETAATET